MTLDAAFQKHPFLLYSPFWIKHAERCNPKSLDKNTIQRASDVFESWSFYPFERHDPEKPRPLVGRYLYGDVYDIERLCVYSNLLVFSANYCFVNVFEALMSGDTEYDQEVLDSALISACDWEFGCPMGSFYSASAPHKFHRLSRHYPLLELEGRVSGTSESDWLKMERIVDLLVKKGADVNKRGGQEHGLFVTPLTAASWWGRLSIVEKLIKEGADVNMVHMLTGRRTGGLFDYATPLIAACWTGRISTVELLLRHGAQVDLRAGRIGSALGEAACKG
ncbi:hypothetical protein TWF481_007852 [Arthrobotrys musiformis]|uniref:Ankyrin n=1 Tax=Arthrobotrys musiformis TaxID=47236 RepID=A0AAV9W7F8_9PEZI